MRTKLKAADGDAPDCFIGPNPESKKVWVIDQVNPETGEFDEPKIMLGYTSSQKAKDGYLANYEDGWKGLGKITSCTLDELKDWLDEDCDPKQFSAYKAQGQTKEAVIKKEKGKYVLYTLDGKKVLGTHATRQQAINQEYAIQKSKEREKSAAQQQTPWDRLPWRDQFVEYIWPQENSGNKGLQSDGTWTTHTDVNKVQSVIGPGIKVPRGTVYTQQQLDAKLQESFNEHVERARQMYPDYDQLPGPAQQILLDTTWQAVPTPKLYEALRRRDYDTAVAENNLRMGDEPLVNRNNARTQRFLNPLRDYWKQNPVPAAPAPAAPVQPPPAIPAAASGLDADTMGNQTTPAVPTQRAPATYTPTTENPPVNWGQDADGKTWYDIKSGSMQQPLTGPMAIAAALSAIDLDSLEQQQREMIKKGPRSKRGQAVKTLGIIEGLKRNELKPAALMVRKIPVLPAEFRPYTTQGDNFVPGDANVLYKELSDMIQSYQQEKAVFGEEGAGKSRLSLYEAVAAVQGRGPATGEKSRQSGISGYLEKVLGSGPKTSFFHRKLLGKTQDFTGRSTIVVDPELDLDEIGLPRELAWRMYGTYVQRNLVRAGMSPGDALRNVRDRTKDAERALAQEIPNRNVVYSRAPVWHKYGTLAGKVKLIDGHAVSINPYVTAGLNADFNGDEQLGKVFVISDKGTLEESLLLYLSCQIGDATCSSMIAKNVIPAFDITKHSLHLVDLQAFPKVEKIGENPNGKNGHIDFYSVPLGTRVVALDESTGKPVWAPVACYSVHKQRELELVHLSNGRQVVTDDDPRAVYGVDPRQDTFEYVRTTPTDALRRRLAVPVVKDVAQSCTTLDSLDSIEATPQSDRRFELDFGFGYLLGALAGDGWWDKKLYRSRKCVYLSDGEGYNAQEVYEQLKRLFGPVSWSRFDFDKDYGDGRYGSTVRHTFSFDGADEFCEFLTRWLGGSGDEKTAGSGNKQLPDFFPVAPREFRMGLLNGLVDTDGTVSVKQDTQQLLLAVTSTSVRLICDLKFLCLTVGVRATIGFSKTTDRGNTSWICHISTPDAKQTDLLARLRTPRKRAAFLDTPVCMDNTSQIYDKVVVPARVYAKIKENLRSPRITAEDPDERAWQAECQNFYQQWWGAETTRLVSRSLALRLVEFFEKATAKAEKLRELALQDLLRDDNELTAERAGIWRKAIEALVPPYGVKDGKHVDAAKQKAKIKAALYRKEAQGRIRGRLHTWLAALPKLESPFEHPDVKNWYGAIVQNTEIAWASVDQVEKTGQKEDGYDLTVPGFETFMNQDGVILSNTVNVHLPSLPEAVEEARTILLPSRMLLKTRNPEEVMPALKQEQVLGLYQATTRPAKAKHTFASPQEALHAVRTGKIRMSDEIEIPGMSDDDILQSL